MKAISMSLGEFHSSFTKSHQFYEINTFEDFFSSELVLNHDKSRLRSIELIPLPQFMFKITTHPYVQGLPCLLLDMAKGDNPASLHTSIAFWTLFPSSLSSMNSTLVVTHIQLDIFLQMWNLQFEGVFETASLLTPS